MANLKKSPPITDRELPKASKSRPATARRQWMIYLLLSLVTLFLFLPVLHFDFVKLDDADYITENPRVISGLTWENVKWAFTTGHASNWHPLTWLSHMLDCQVYGLKPAG